MSAEDWLWIEARSMWLRGDGLELWDDGQDWRVRSSSSACPYKLCDSVCAPSQAQREADRDFPTDLLKEDRGWLEAEARMASAAHEEAQHRAAYQDRRRARLQAALRALKKREKAQEIAAKRERKRNPFGLPVEVLALRRADRMAGRSTRARRAVASGALPARGYSWGLAVALLLARARWLAGLEDAARWRRVFCETGERRALQAIKQAVREAVWGRLAATVGVLP